MTALLRVANLTLRRGTREILRGVSLHADCGEIVALMGLSGGGKTTILRAIAALEPFDGGRISVEDVSLEPGRASRAHVAELRRHVGMVFQHHSLFEHLSAIDNVTLAPVHVDRKSLREAQEIAMQLLESLGVAHRRNALPRELSGGEAQRVAIARAMAMDPPLLLMDEPTASLDPARRSELGLTLRQLASEGRTLVVTTHDDDFARDFAQRVVILADGEVVEEGAARSVLDAPRHPATKLLLQSVHEGAP